MMDPREAVEQAIFRTEAGSTYHVMRDANDNWWFCADNVVTIYSQTCQDSCWQIEKPKPWPPVVGERMLLLSKYLYEPGHILRIPGGGKHTSNVVEVWHSDDD